MEILEKLFGSLAKAKLIKLFVFNPEAQLSKDEVMVRAKLSQSECRRALNILIKLGVDFLPLEKLRDYKTTE